MNTDCFRHDVTSRRKEPSTRVAGSTEVAPTLYALPRALRNRTATLPPQSQALLRPILMRALTAVRAEAAARAAVAATPVARYTCD